MVRRSASQLGGAGALLLGVLLAPGGCGRSARTMPEAAGSEAGKRGSSDAGGIGGSTSAGGMGAGGKGGGASVDPGERACNCEESPDLCAEETYGGRVCRTGEVGAAPKLEEALQVARFKGQIFTGGYYECDDGTRRFSWVISFEGACQLVFDSAGTLAHVEVEASPFCGPLPATGGEVTCRTCRMSKYNPPVPEPGLGDAGAAGAGGEGGSTESLDCWVDADGNTVMPPDAPTVLVDPDA